MKLRKSMGAVAAVGLTLCVADVAHGQWVDRSYSLHAGWNAVYLEVDPSPETADELFSAYPISEVWALTPAALKQGPPECQDPNDPTCVPVVRGAWDVWLPIGDPHRVAANLSIVRGGRVYLIRADAATTLSLTGRPNAGRSDWREGYNLVGFHVEDDANAAPTFAAYLAGSPSLASAEVRQVTTDGSTQVVSNPANSKIVSGTGYWVRSGGATRYDGPIDVDNGSLRGIDFDIALTEHPLRLENHLGSAASVSIEYRSSDTVPSTPATLPVNAGDVPLKWLDYVSGPAEAAFQWQPLPASSVALAPAEQDGSRGSIDFSIDRTGLGQAVLDANGEGAEYQGVLVVRDGAGYRRFVPVAGQSPGGIAQTVAGGVPARPGLYLGQVTVNQVQWVTAGARVWTNDDPTDPQFAEDKRCFGGVADGAPCSDDQKCPGGTCTGYCLAGGNADGSCTYGTDCPASRCSAETDNVSLRPTATPFVFPVLMHLDANGVYRMLTEVTLLWQPPNEGAGTPGRYVLATPGCDPGVCGPLEAASVQDGEPFARRIGTAAFSFDGDLPLTGSFGDALGGAYDIAEDDPLNPYRHKYHPDHDCDQVGECMAISRSFVLDFEATPPPGDTRPGWGDNILGGTYAETLTGLNKEPISVGGRFELTRVSNVDTLNGE